MTEPLITPGDLGTYLNDPSIQTARAQMMIDQAMQACESVVSPIPAEAGWVVMRVAGRGYMSATVRGPQMGAGGSPLGTTGIGLGAIWLTRADKADLRRLSGGGGSFTIDLLPTDYVAPRSGLLSGDLPQYGQELYGSSGFDVIP